MGNNKKKKEIMEEYKFIKDDRDTLKEAKAILLRAYEETHDEMFEKAYDKLFDVLMNTGVLK